MTYTIYLFGYKFMVKWNDDNDLLSTELLMQKSLSNEISTAKEIIEITQKSINYIDKNYTFRKIYWLNDSLYIKVKPVNKPGIKINIQKLEFIISEKDNVYKKSFSDLDINQDDFLNNNELENISALRFDYLLTNKNKILKSNLIFQIQNNIYFKI